MAVTPEPAVKPPPDDSVAEDRAPDKDDSGEGPAIDGPDNEAGGGTQVSCGLFRATAIPIGTELSKTTKKKTFNKNRQFVSLKQEKQHWTLPERPIKFLIINKKEESCNK